MGLKLNGATSGSIEIDVPAVAGTDTAITIPATSGGEFIVSDSSGNIDLGPLDINGGASDDSVNIDGSGRLLVGTPTARLDFFNSTSIGPAFQIEGNDVGNRIATIVSNNTGGGAGAVLALGHEKSGSTGGSTAVANNDLIGRLSFQGHDGTTFVESAFIESFVDSDVGTDDMPGRLVFSTTADGASSPTERMRISSPGEVYINNTSRDAAVGSNCKFQVRCLHAEHTAVFRNTNATPYGPLIVYDTDKNNTGAQFLRCNGGSTIRAEIRSNGGLANYSANNANLCDEREKKNIEALDSTWGCLKNWELKKFHYNEDADTDDKRYGVIAQQVAPHCPEVITEWVKQKAKDAVLDDDGNVVTPAVEEINRMAVKEQQMMWMAIKALQEAQTRIETLETRVAQLEGGAA